MQRLSTFSVPFLPLCRYFTDCGVGAARHIADDTIVADASILANLTVLVAQLGEHLRIMIGNDDAGGVQPIHLMGQHEGPLGGRIIGHNKALGLLLVRFLLPQHLIGPYELEELGSFATWCGAHIQYGVVRVDI